MSETITDAEVVPETAALAIREPQHEVSLWSTTDPVEVIQQATRLADAYKDVVKRKGLIANIRGREHPQVEAWQLLGSMLGVHPVPVGEPSVLPWPEPVPDALKPFRDRGMTFGFSAAYTAVKGGEIVGGGQSRCSRTEKTWKDRDDFALASMAQTRAISKALSGPLRFVMTLAGYEATPAEEMPSDAPAADRTRPHGPEVDAELKAQIGPAVLKILGGDEDRARATYKQITIDLGVNYMPVAAARALVTVAASLQDLPRSPELVGAPEIRALQDAAKELKDAQVKQAMAACNVTPPDPFVKTSCFLRVPRDKAAVLVEALSSADVPWAGELPTDPVAPEVS